jgi:sigma-B regulation protein RsbU (phosphoserine phosphatase)
VFVFYTDGISEAMNRTREEYGAERLSSSIEAHAQKDASGILDGVLTDMRQFVGKAEQHDDVTLVVVKIV